MKMKFKKALPVLLVVSLAMTGLTGCGEKTTYEHTIELGENYTFDATEIFGVNKKEAKEYEAILTTLDTNTAGKYEVKVVKGNKEYTVIYTVEDTKAPEVKMVEKYIFTNNIDETDFTKLVDMKDASEVTEKLCKFKKLDDMKVLSLDVVETYTKEITGTATTEELLERLDDPIGTDGIYNAVYVAEDAYGHKTAKEVIVIYDTENPSFMGIENIPEEVKLTDATIDNTDIMLDKLIVTDNCDGVISASSLDVNTELTDASKNTYKIDVSYTDRAGNTAGAQYSITFTVDGETDIIVNVNSNNNKSDSGSTNSNAGNSGSNSHTGSGNSNTGNSGSNSNTGSSNSNTGNSGSNSNTGSSNSNTGNSGSNSNTGSSNSNTGNSGSTDSGNSGTTTSNSKYSYEDLDGDGYADLGPVTEMNGFLIPTEDVTVEYAKNQKALSEAGYFNPILLEDGKSYAMIIPYGEDYYDFFDNWLREEQGIQASSLSCDPWDMEEKAEIVKCYDYIYIKDIITDEL